MEPKLFEVSIKVGIYAKSQEEANIVVIDALKSQTVWIMPIDQRKEAR